MASPLIILVFLTLVCMSFSCDPVGYREVSLIEMAHRAPIIAYGTVIDTIYEVDYYPEAFTAVFEVKCTYKGGPIAPKISITLAGYVPGMCGYRNFTVGEDYIAFLRHNQGNEFEQIYDVTKGAEDNLADLMTFCDLHLEYPLDVQDSGVCPMVVTDGCQVYEPEPDPGVPAQEPEPTTTAVPTLGTTKSFKSKLLEKVDAMIDNQEQELSFLKELVELNERPISDILPYPMDTKEEIVAMSSRIHKSSQFKRKFSSYMARLAGPGCEETMDEMLRKVGTRKLWEELSLDDQMKKATYEHPAIFKVLLNVCVRMNNVSVGDAEKTLMDSVKKAIS